MDVLETLDNLQNAAEQDSEKNKSNNKKSEYHFDKLRMYFGEDYTINNITISVPTIGDILEVGETNLYHLFSITQHQLGFSYMILFTRIGTKPKTLKYFI